MTCVVVLTVVLSETGGHAHIHLLPAPAPGNLLWHQLCPREQPAASGAPEDESDGRDQGADIWDQVCDNVTYLHQTWQPTFLSSLKDNLYKLLHNVAMTKTKF